MEQTPNTLSVTLGADAPGRSHFGKVIVGIHLDDGRRVEVSLSGLRVPADTSPTYDGLRQAVATGAIPVLEAAIQTLREVSVVDAQERSWAADAEAGIS